MKLTISAINEAIDLKKNNGKMGYNFYEWLQQIKQDLYPNLSLFQIWKMTTGQLL